MVSSLLSLLSQVTFCLWLSVMYINPRFMNIIFYIYWKPDLLFFVNVFSVGKYLFKVNNNIAIPSGIYLMKVNNGNIRTVCEICSKLTIKTPERRQWCRSGVFVIFGQISLIFLVFPLLSNVHGSLASSNYSFLDSHQYLL